MVIKKARSAFCDEAGTFFNRTGSVAEIFCHLMEWVWKGFFGAGFGKYSASFLKCSAFGQAGFWKYFAF